MHVTLRHNILITNFFSKKKCYQKKNFFSKIMKRNVFYWEKYKKKRTKYLFGKEDFFLEQNMKIKCFSYTNMMSKMYNKNEII